MNTKELRIGNFVNDTDDTFHIVSAVYKNGIEMEFNDLRYFIDEDVISPILLTEEWLPRFGFTCETIQGNQNEFRVYTKGQFVFNTNHGWWINGKSIKVQPKYVHRLQNLYFEIEDVELQLSST